MKYRNIYYLFDRTVNGKIKKYVQFVDSVSGTRRIAKSVNKLLKDLPWDYPIKEATTDVKAHKICDDWIIWHNNQDENKIAEYPLFLDYLKLFWDYDNSPYIQGKLLEDENSIHKAYCNKQCSFIKNHIQPFCNSYKVIDKLTGKLVTKQGFLNNLHINELESWQFQDMREVIIREKSKSVWNSTRQVMVVCINYLLENETIEKDPMRKSKQAHVEKKTKGSFTSREVERLVIQMFEDWKNGREVKVLRPLPNKKAELRDFKYHLDRRVFLATCLAACTGMRKGETLALRLGNIKFVNSDDRFENQALINVNESISKIDGFKSTKTGKSRFVPIPRWLADDLVSLAKTNPFYLNAIENKTDEEIQKIEQRTLVFYSDLIDGQPINFSVLNKFFYRELAEIGITEEVRKERNLSFHSLRHFFNSYGVTCLGGDITRLLLGHTDPHKMTELYLNRETLSEKVLEWGKETSNFIPNPYQFVGEAV